jgi:hypothetical protein
VKYAPNSAARPLELPQHPGIPFQIHIEKGEALGRARATVSPWRGSGYRDFCVRFIL